MVALADRFSIRNQDVLDVLEQLDRGPVFNSNKSAILTRCALPVHFAPFSMLGVLKYTACGARLRA